MFAPTLDPSQLSDPGPWLCVDYVNTLDWRGSPQTIESLHSYGDLLIWGQHVGVLDDADVERLARVAGDDPDRAESSFARAIEFREAAYRLLLAHARQEQPPPGDLALINAEAQIAFDHQRITPAADGFEWRWATGDDLARVVWPVALSVADLLVSADLERLRECEGHGCGWLFLDTTRNRSRRWCSMETCGNRAKARRHYERQRARTS